MNMNDKGVLQELCQKRGFEHPVYSSVSSEGADHCRTFTQRVTVIWEGRTISKTGQARSKKEADKSAARAMLEYLRKVAILCCSPCVYLLCMCVGR